MPPAVPLGARPWECGTSTYIRPRGTGAYEEGTGASAPPGRRVQAPEQGAPRGPLHHQGPQTPRAGRLAADPSHPHLGATQTPSGGASRTPSPHLGATQTPGSRLPCRPPHPGATCPPAEPCQSWAAGGDGGEPVSPQRQVGQPVRLEAALSGSLWGHGTWEPPTVWGTWEAVPAGEAVPWRSTRRQLRAAAWVALPPGAWTWVEHPQRHVGTSKNSRLLPTCSRHRGSPDSTLRLQLLRATCQSRGWPGAMTPGVPHTEAGGCGRAFRAWVTKH